MDAPETKVVRKIAIVGLFLFMDSTTSVHYFLVRS
jgi:hypothetical protein